MNRRPPRSTRDRSSAASDVYKRQGVNFVIPGNDDAARAIGLYCDLVARAALDGMSAQMGAAGIDLGALETAPVEEAVAEA